jgi:hypothetical protein
LVEPIPDAENKTPFETPPTAECAPTEFLALSAPRPPSPEALEALEKLILVIKEFYSPFI